MPSQDLPSVIFYFVIHSTFFLESDREKRDGKGFSLWESMNQHYIVPSRGLALLVLSLFPLSEVKDAELGTGRVILVQLFYQTDEFCFTLPVSLWLQERSNQVLMLATGKYTEFECSNRGQFPVKEPCKVA